MDPTPSLPSRAKAAFDPAKPAIFALDDPGAVEILLEQMVPERREGAQVLDDWRGLLERQDGGGTLVVSLPVLEFLSRFHAERLQEILRAHLVILALRLPDFLASSPAIELADGLAFLDANLGQWPEVLDLARHGYSLLPAPVMMEIVTDKVRCDLLGRFSFLDLRILDMIRLARSNQAISQNLSLSEANIKTKVRAILKRLKFRNRTEAAVFAARHERAIRRLLARGPLRRRPALPLA